MTTKPNLRTRTKAAAAIICLAALTAGRNAFADARLQEEGKMEGKAEGKVTLSEISVEGESAPDEKGKLMDVKEGALLVDRKRFDLGGIYPIETRDETLVRYPLGEQTGGLYQVSLNPDSVRTLGVGLSLVLEHKGSMNEFNKARRYSGDGGMTPGFMYFSLNASYSSLRYTGYVQRMMPGSTSYVPSGPKEAGEWNGNLLTLTPSIGIAMSLLSVPSELAVYSDINWQNIRLKEGNPVDQDDPLKTKSDSKLVLGQSGLEMRLRGKAYESPTFKISRFGIAHVGNRFDNLMAYITPSINFGKGQNSEVNLHLTPYAARIATQFRVGGELKPVEVSAYTDSLRLTVGPVARAEYNAGTKSVLWQTFAHAGLQLVHNLEAGAEVGGVFETGPQEPKLPFTPRAKLDLTFRN